VARTTYLAYLCSNLQPSLSRSNRWWHRYQLWG
jgi:hypothetical protein